MKLIPLSQGMFTMVDDEDFEFLMHWNWVAEKQPCGYYVHRKENFNNKQKTIRMHRVIMGVVEEIQVDHIDHNPLNNQRNNLRKCTAAQNSMNRKARGASGYLGVWATSSGNKYFSSITKDKIVYRLGRFKTKEAAARAYDAKAKELFGEFANLNFK